jgi:hypothetical protein
MIDGHEDSTNNADGTPKEKPTLWGDAVKFRDGINDTLRGLDNFFRDGIATTIAPLAAKAVASCQRGLSKLEDKIKARIEKP